MTIPDYILNLTEINETQSTLVQATHDLLCTLIPQVQASIKWKVPYYIYRKKHLCYVNALKKGGGIEMCFTHAKLLSNEQGLLRENGRKYIMGITIQSLEALYQDAIAAVILEAVAVNEALADGTLQSDWYSSIHKK